jgi:oligopeptide/dipeptide ABC transporter ATP-binding protein
MYLGRVVEMAEAKRLVRAPKHPYTQALLSAVPVIDPDSKRKRIMLPGDVPSPITPPSGCTFHPRCAIKEARCELNSPVLTEVEPGHWVSCHLALDGGKRPA